MLKRIGRLLTAMATPFAKDGKVSYSETANLARYLIENGSDGVVVAGTTGESPVLTVDEKLKLFSTVKDAVGEKGAVIAGTGSNSTADTIYLTKRAAETGVDGIMVVTPYYNKPSQEGLYQHFKAIAQETDLPIIMYNVPGRTSVNLLPPTVIRLALIKNIFAVKEASGNLDQVAEIKRGVHEDFLIYSGDDSLTLPMLSIGGYGVISVVSHIAGNMIKEMIENFFAGKIKEASELHLKLFPLYKALFMTTNPVPVKAALNLMGLKTGEPRLPLVPATEKEIDTIRQVMVDTGIIPC